MEQVNEIDDKIIREWIEKAKPLVDNVWNLAIDNAIRKVVNERSIEVLGSTSYAILTNAINAIQKLKTPIQ